MQADYEYKRKWRQAKASQRSKACLHCGCVFVPTRAHFVTCSVACAAERKRHQNCLRMRKIGRNSRAWREQHPDLAAKQALRGNVARRQRYWTDRAWREALKKQARLKHSIDFLIDHTLQQIAQVEAEHSNRRSRRNA